jgi:DNA-binding transcriptional LysR family regulator
MGIADLKVFEAVARLGGMNRAAMELNTVQSKHYGSDQSAGG